MLSQIASSPFALDIEFEVTFAIGLGASGKHFALTAYPPYADDPLKMPPGLYLVKEGNVCGPVSLDQVRLDHTPVLDIACAELFRKYVVFTEFVPGNWYFGDAIARPSFAGSALIADAISASDAAELADALDLFARAQLTVGAWLWPSVARYPLFRATWGDCIAYGVAITDKFVLLAGSILPASEEVTEIAMEQRERDERLRTVSDVDDGNHTLSEDMIFCDKLAATRFAFGMKGSRERIWWRDAHQEQAHTL